MHLVRSWLATNIFILKVQILNRNQNKQFHQKKSGFIPILLALSFEQQTSFYSHLLQFPEIFGGRCISRWRDSSPSETTRTQYEGPARHERTELAERFARPFAPWVVILLNTRTLKQGRAETLSFASMVKPIPVNTSHLYTHWCHTLQQHCMRIAQ